MVSSGFAHMKNQRILFVEEMDFLLSDDAQRNHFPSYCARQAIILSMQSYSIGLAGKVYGREFGWLYCVRELF